VAKKKATAPKPASSRPAKGAAPRSAPVERRANSRGEKAARAAKGNSRKSSAPPAGANASGLPQPAEKASPSNTRPSRGKPARDKHSTLDAAAAGERASFLTEPPPAVQTRIAENPKARRREARGSASAAPEAMPKTRLTDKQLAEFKELLLAKRTELLSDVRMLTKDALGKSRKDSAGDLSSMPIHMADIGSDNWEQDFTLGLIANERQLVREIDDALQRIENRTFGICLATHKPITVARLRAKPWAKFCIEYAQQLERRGY
jgi:RNA polymerase-binding protein DksA